MVKTRVEVRVLRNFHKLLESDVPGGMMLGLGHDRPISSRKLKALHQQMKEHIDAYSKTKKFIHLVRLHDRAEDFVAENMFSVNAIRLNQFLKEKFAQTAPVKRINAFWSKVDKNNLVMKREVAGHILALSRGSDASEFSGGAKVVEKEGKYFVEPNYSTIERSPFTFPAHYENLLASGSHLLWHTHHVSVNQLRLSFGDRKVSEMARVPIMVVTSSHDGKPVFEINVGDKVYPIRIIN